MKNTVEQREDEKETERNNFFLPDPIKAGILVLAH